MKLVHIVFVAIFLFSMSFSANSEDFSSKFLAMVHKANFVGCDSAILKNFDGYIKSPDGRVTTDSFKKGGNTYSITATWGKMGDSIYQRTVFEKNGAACQAYQTTIIAVDDNCMAYKEKTPAWKYVEATGDYIWTTNTGGVDALMQTTKGGSCNVIYQITKNFPAD
jgi:hypothetical protein